MRKILISIALLIAATTNIQSTSAQTAPPGQVDLFCGAELNYADVNFLRLYNVLINLTPGVKYTPARNWECAVQAFIPVANYGYDDRLNYWRLNMAEVSRQFHFTNIKQHFKLSAGLFGKERFGADMRWIWPVNSWLMINGRASVSRHWCLAFGWEGETENEWNGKPLVTAQLGASVYLQEWDTEFRMFAGRFLNEDKGMQCEIMRHFKHCTVGLYAQYHERGDTRYSKSRTAGGFKVIVALPGQKPRINPATHEPTTLQVRPAEAFRLTYNAQSDGVSMKTFDTDPEENERDYGIDHIGWGFRK